MSFWNWLKSLFKKKKDTFPSSEPTGPADTSADQEYRDSYDLENEVIDTVETPVPEKSNTAPVIPGRTEEDGEPPVTDTPDTAPVIPERTEENEEPPVTDTPDTDSRTLGTGHRYFTIEELCASRTAVIKRIDNTPSTVIRQHLNVLIEQLLDPIREAWGSAINVTSGYRCPALNSAVGGVKTSAHKYGWAADLQPRNGLQVEFERFIRNWAKTTPGIRYDQIIVEKSKSARWVHVGLYNASGQQRMQLFDLQVYGSPQDPDGETGMNEEEWPL